MFSWIKRKWLKFRKWSTVDHWIDLFVDQTAVGVYQKYCPIEEWSKLPNK